MTVWARSIVPAALLLWIFASLATAQQNDGSSTDTVACATPEYRQFDFWIGSWVVTNPEGEVAGTNTIDRDYDGCVVRESWEGARGMTGTSLNTYDPHTGTWHQTWVDDRGGFLLLSGALEDGSMVLSGEMRDEEGPILHRITWTPLETDRVRQLWEASRDGGATWNVLFEGLYARRELPGGAKEGSPAPGD